MSEQQLFQSLPIPFYMHFTRFGTGEEWIAKIEALTGEKVISSIKEAEPFGPSNPLDAMVIAPMTGIV